MNINLLSPKILPCAGLSNFISYYAEQGTVCSCPATWLHSVIVRPHTLSAEVNNPFLLPSRLLCLARDSSFSECRKCLDFKVIIFDVSHKPKDGRRLNPYGNEQPMTEKWCQPDKLHFPPFLS